MAADDEHQSWLSSVDAERLRALDARLTTTSSNSSVSNMSFHDSLPRNDYFFKTIGHSGSNGAAAAAVGAPTNPADELKRKREQTATEVEERKPRKQSHPTKVQAGSPRGGSKRAKTQAKDKPEQEQQQNEEPSQDSPDDVVVVEPSSAQVHPERSSISPAPIIQANHPAATTKLYMGSSPIAVSSSSSVPLHTTSSLSRSSQPSSSGSPLVAPPRTKLAQPNLQNFFARDAAHSSEMSFSVSQPAHPPPPPPTQTSSTPATQPVGSRSPPKSRRASSTPPANVVSSSSSVLLPALPVGERSPPRASHYPPASSSSLSSGTRAIPFAPIAEEQQSRVTILEQRLQQLEEENRRLGFSYQEALKGHLRELAFTQRAFARAACSANVSRLGYATMERSGHSMKDTWVYGSELQMLHEKIARITRLLKDREAEKKKAKSSKDKTAPPTEPLADLDKFAGEQYEEQLKRDKKDFEVQLGKLEMERALHARECKRILDEERARHQLGDMLNGQYIIMALLGKGGFSEVFKAYDLVHCRYVACKVHRVHADWSEPQKIDYIKHSTREYEIHKSLNHKYIASFYDVFEVDANSFCTVLEYCDGFDLDFVLKQRHHLPESEAKVKMAQIVAVLEHLSHINPPIIHYDLKPANILLMSDGTVKITDFGLSKLVYDGALNGIELTSQGAGTYWYLPPECFQRPTPRITSAVDVWSLGVIFYQCLFGRKPFGDNESQQSILRNTKILQEEVAFPPPSEGFKISDGSKEFIRQCLQKDPAHRPPLPRLVEMTQDLLRKKDSKAAKS